jgi:XTP/dITP diphosphohydrolase
MAPVTRLVLASNNAKKLLELQALFTTLPLRLVAQSALQIAEADEPHGTFVENALAKARHAALHAEGPAIADDSGLCVDALGGEPGVASAHYAAAVAVADGGDREQRRARQDAASTLVALRHAHDPEPLIAFGRWELELLREPRGSGGFGYDPVVLAPDHGISVAELSATTKNAISHRARAAQQMAVLMREVWRIG